MKQSRPKGRFSWINIILIFLCLMLITFLALSVLPEFFLSNGRNKVNVDENIKNQLSRNQEENNSGGIEEDIESVGKDKKENIEDSTVEEIPSYDQEEQGSETVTIRVYYADEEVQYLVGEERVVSTSHKYLSAILELLKPPITPGLINLIPKTTKVNQIHFKDGNVVLDLSREFMEDRFKSDAVDVLLVYSIVNTLTEFFEVSTITFLINGEEIETIGQLDVSGPLYRDESWIGGN